MSVSRDSAIVPLSTNAVRFGPHQLFPEPSVMSPGILIWSAGQSVSGFPANAEVRRLTSRPLTAARVEWCAPQSDMMYPWKPFSPLRIWFNVRSFSHAHDALIWSVPSSASRNPITDTNTHCSCT